MGLENKGKSSQISFRYEIPINKIYRYFQHSINLGFDYKSSNNNIATVEEASRVTISQPADLTQFLSGYQLIYETKNNKMVMQSDIYFSPIRWLANQTKQKYSALHAFANPKYFYFKLFFENEYTFKYNWAINAKLRGQIANQNLLPSEQYYLGGEDTLRGYENRIVTRDDVINLNLEFKTPPLDFIFKKNKKVTEQLRFYSFLDFGMAKDHRKSFTIDDQSLLGTGVGFKYNLDNKVNIKFDWGFPLFKIPNKDYQNIYLSVIFSL